MPSMSQTVMHPESMPFVRRKSRRRSRAHSSEAKGDDAEPPAASSPVGETYSSPPKTLMLTNPSDRKPTHTLRVRHAYRFSTASVNEWGGGIRTVNERTYAASATSDEDTMPCTLKIYIHHDGEVVYQIPSPDATVPFPSVVPQPIPFRPASAGRCGRARGSRRSRACAPRDS